MRFIVRRQSQRSNPESVLALTNLASMAFVDGDADLAWATAQRLANSSDSDRSEIGQGWAALVEASVDADLRKTIDLLTRIRVAQHARGHGHHEAITLINLALHYKVRGDAVSTLRDARAAMSLLANDPAGAEMASARAVTAWALAHQGDLEAARDLHRLALAEANEGSRVEVLLEGAEIELLYGSAKRAVDLRDQAAPLVASTPWIKPFANVMDAAIALREQRLDLAGSIVEDFRVGEFSIGAGLKAQQLALRAQWSLLSTRPEANAAIRVAIEHAESQGADFWLEIDRLLLGMAKGRSALNREVRRLSEGGSVYFGALAEPFVERLADLEPEEFACVRLEMERRPERWLTALRDALTNGSESAGRAAQCLDVIGSADDVPLLRRFSKRRAAERDLGKGLARRVAEKVFVEDQGRVAIKIGARRVEGTQIRRKVLTLLCFLLSRPRFSSTRDEVLEALWPEFEPTVALNSLN